MFTTSPDGGSASGNGASPGHSSGFDLTISKSELDNQEAFTKQPEDTDPDFWIYMGNVSITAIGGALPSGCTKWKDPGSYSFGFPVTIKVIKCPTCASTMCPSASMKSVEFSIPFKAGEFNTTSQTFSLHCDRIVASSYNRATLNWSKALTPNQPRSGSVTDSGGLRQLLSGGYLADLSDLPSGKGYTMRFYTPDMVGAKGADGLYAAGGSSYMQYTVENPDSTAAGRLKITQVSSVAGTTKTTEYLYTDQDTRWVLEQRTNGTLVRRETLDKTLTSSGTGNNLITNESQVRTVEQADSTGALQVVSKTKETYRKLNNAPKYLVEHVDGYGTSASRTTAYAYYEDPGVPVAFLRQKSVQKWDGSWVQYFYESGTGTSVTRTVEGYKNAAFGDASHAKVTIRTTSSIQDASGVRQTERSQTTIGGVTTASTLTVTRRSADGGRDQTTTTSLPNGIKTVDHSIYSAIDGASPSSGRLRSHLLADGTVERVSYAAGSGDGSWTMTSERGAGSESAVTDGTRTVTHYNGNGVLDGETVTDIASGVTLSTKVATATDELGRPTKWQNSGSARGGVAELSYGCCGIDWQITDDGTRTVYQYDDFKRVVSQTVTVGSRVETTRTEYAGFSTRQFRDVGTGEQLVSQSVSSLVGDVTSTSQIAGNATSGQLVSTTTNVTALGGGGRRETSTNPDGSVSVSEYFADGQISRRVERQGWATQLESVYDYGTHSEQGGGTWQKETQNGTRFTKTYIGLGGITIKRENSAFVGTVATTTFSTDAYGRVVKTTGPGGASTITTYDALGRVSGTSLSVGNGLWATSSRVQRMTSAVVASASIGGGGFGAGTLQTTSVFNDAGGEVVLSRSWRSVDGLSSATESRGLLSTLASTVHSGGAWTETATGPDGSKQVRNYADGRLAHSITCDGGGAQLSQTDFGYDALGRVTTQTDRRDGSAALTTTMTYYDGGQIRTLVTPYDAANNTGGTAYSRDINGRETSVRLPDGTTKTTEYRDAEGAVKVSGSQTYPSETKSDAFGQMLSLTTWQDFAGNSGAATTTWTYDPSSGLLSRKQYADGKGTGYTYDSSGRLLTRTWARGITTNYSYSPAGDLVGVVYSDGTPGVSFSYDGNGNQLTAGGISYTINPSTLLTDSETVPVGNSSRTITRGRDGYLRDTGFSLANGDITEAGTAWTYDSAGRPASVTASSSGAVPQTFTYQWVAGRPQLVEKVTGPAVTVQNSYEPLRDILASKSNQASSGGTEISGFTYVVNGLGQRTSVQHTGSAFATPAFNVYSYDGLGQVTSSNRFTGGSLAAPSGPVAGQQFGFAYDTIGNRKTATDGVTTTAYTPNALNQYNQIQEGAALTEPTYDADGNLLTDSVRSCQWDGENRLVSVTKADGTQVVNAYDALSRRVRKTVKQGTTVTSDTAYVYDGWNVIAEYNLTSGSPALAAVNTWGLDLSNSRQGAGGVGGLLARATSAATLAYTFDGNGNVSELVTAAGSVAGHYEYGPFGQTTAQTDSDATGTFAANPYRFSTKPLDAESGLYYYGYRHYNPVLGRWINRDPIQENGGKNLYGYCLNNPVAKFDPLGLAAELYNGDTDSLQLSPDPSISKQGKTFFDINGIQVDIKDLSFVNTIKVTGKLGLRLVYNPNFITNPEVGPPFDPTGRTTAQHERAHAAAAKYWWNGMAKELNALEGVHCGACASLSKNLVAKILEVYKAAWTRDDKALDANSSYDPDWNGLSKIKSDYTAAKCNK